MKSTATVTWITWRNYGTFLQAYALQQVLLRHGYRNYIISDASHVREPHLSWKQQLCLLLQGRYDWSRFAYERFKRRYLLIREPGDAPEVDVHICGSDQIWSPYLEFDPYYYLDFVRGKKIAYAPSTGTGFSTPEYRENVLRYLPSFAHLSARERCGAEMLSTLLQRPVETVLDPTLLLSGDEWRQLKRRVRRRKFLLCYFLTDQAWYVDYARRYADTHGLRLIVLATQPSYRRMADVFLHAGPSEFLSYIDEADMVLTDSFHATIFSILLQTPFACFKRFEDGAWRDQNPRVRELLGLLGLAEYLISPSHVEAVESLAVPPWEHVAAKLEPAKQHSLQYLIHAIEH